MKRSTVVVGTRRTSSISSASSGLLSLVMPERRPRKRMFEMPSCIRSTRFTSRMSSIMRAEVYSCGLKRLAASCSTASLLGNPRPTFTCFFTSLHSHMARFSSFTVRPVCAAFMMTTRARGLRRVSL